MTNRGSEYKAVELAVLLDIARPFEPAGYKFRASTHSFTGFVTEVWFKDGDSAVQFAGLMKELMGIFIALRVKDEEHCYCSVPTEPDF